MKELVEVTGQFTELDQTVTLNIPNLSSVVALRLYRATTSVAVVCVADPAIKSTHPRFFKLLGTGDLPETYLKYVGTFPFEGVAAHVIEVTAEPKAPEATLRTESVSDYRLDHAITDKHSGTHRFER